MGDMAVSIRSNSETRGPVESQECKPLVEPPLPAPGPRIRTFPQASNLVRTSRELGWQVAQACPGRSWLTHAWVVFESPRREEPGGRDPWSSVP